MIYMPEEYGNKLYDLVYLLSNKDFRKFIIYLPIVAIFTYLSMDIISRSWNTGIMEQSANTIRNMSQSGISFLTNFVIGFFISSIILMYTDRRKKVQAIILSVGLISIIVYMIIKFSTDWNWIYILLGGVLGVIAGGGIKKDIIHKQATNNVCIASILYIVISYLNIYIIQNQPPIEDFLKDSVVILGFSYFFGMMMNYKGKNMRIFVLGPGRSGKSVFMVGCYKAILNKAESPTRPNSNLLNAYNQLHKMRTDLTELTTSTTSRDTSRDGVESDYWLGITEETKDYEFTCEAGKLFPKEILFRTIDYSGAFLKNLPDAMYKIILEDMDILTKKYIEVANEITASDKLIFILDGRKYPIFDEIIHYIDIINKLYKKGKKFEPYIVVTKSDIFMEEFRKREYLEFKKFVEDKFSNNDYIRMLFIETSIKSLYPVFYDTEKDASGILRPLRDRDGKLFVFGFDEFMDILLE